MCQKCISIEDTNSPAEAVKIYKAAKARILKVWGVTPKILQLIAKLDMKINHLEDGLKKAKERIQYI